MGSKRAEVLGSFHLAPLRPVLSFWFGRLWPEAAVHFAPYGQLLEQLRGASPARRGPAEGDRPATLALLRPEDLLRTDGRLPNPQAKFGAARAHLSEIAEALADPPGASAAVVGLPPASCPVVDDPRLRRFDRWARATMEEAIERSPLVHLAPLDDLQTLYGVREVHDPIRDEYGHIPYTDEYLAAVGTALVRSLSALWEPPRKVIALDCDNTLWGGACGEDGIESLVLDGPYRELRRFMRGQADSGRLLCLVSRNREADALAALRRCAEPLQSSHIAAHRIRTEGTKSAALLSLAEELGLSPDSFVFVDDDPVECAEVRAALPGVAVVELPRNPADIPTALAHAWELDVAAVTDEDRRRTGFYAAEARRRREQSAAPGLREFVDGLRVEVGFQDLDAANLARAAQILARTNQMNLTGARWSEGELSAAARRQGNEVLVVGVRDRLGDYGLVGVLVLEERGARLHLAVFALSCRVLNRGVEAEILREVGRRGRVRGCGELSIAFRDTGRNAPAAAMLGQLLCHREPPPETDLRVDLGSLPARVERLRPGWSE
jgi:FkbH-like protein